MSIRNLESLFRPRSIALIGASTRPNSVGATVMRNLLLGGFSGPVMPVNPKYASVGGVLCYPSVADLPQDPDLAIICTPPATVPGLITQLGELGTRAAIVLTAGLEAKAVGGQKSYQQLMLESARPKLLRILGPNCVGLIVPGVGLNGSFAHGMAKPGQIAFVSQSGALATAVLDWAMTRDIGFSHFVSLGNSADVDFGDILDFLGSDAGTHSILLYIESVKHARKFMSAARAAARNKPVIVLKAGRVAEGAQAAASHTGALAGADDVYDAAFRRAGMLRVDSIEDLFDAVETLGRAKPIPGERLTIVTNGGGPGVMATDMAIARGLQIATLSPDSIQALDAVLPGTWSKRNPVDIIGDAPAQRYLDALRIVDADPHTDAILFIQAPTAIVPSETIASALVPCIQQLSKPVFACWLGGKAVARAQQLFVQNGVPSYHSPEDAVGAISQMIDFRRNQASLLETPRSYSEEFVPDIGRAQRIIAQVLAEGRQLLTETEAKDVLNAYHIPSVETRVATSAQACSELAEQIGFPIALKILSPDITHKSDVGGVALGLESSEQVASAAASMLSRVQERHPTARILGFTVQKMVSWTAAHELICGASEDPIFGPVILFGQGGTAVEIIADRAVSLPPLNMALARDLVSRTRVAKLLAGYRDRPAANLDAIYLTLIKLSQLIADIPQVRELDINPLLANAQGVLALDARLKVVHSDTQGSQRLAIRPYPHELQETIEFDGRPLDLRPIRPEDEPAHRKFIAQLNPEDIRFRFFGLVRELEHSQMARYTQIDYEREMAFIATRRETGETLGVARIVIDPDNTCAEFAIAVRSDLKGKGLGSLLLEKLIRYCNQRHTQRVVGHVLPDNFRMLALAKKYGFQLSDETGNGSIEAFLSLPTHAPAAKICDING